MELQNYKKDEKLFLDLIKEDKGPCNQSEYLKKVKSWSWLFSLMPFVKEVAICNNVAFGVCDKESDIDLFFVLDRRRFYLARFVISVLIEIFGLRRKGSKVAGRFCLSFFVADDQLDFGEILIENDVYFYYWFKSLIFLKGNEDIQKDFMKANKSWFREDDFSFKNMTYVSSPKILEWLLGLKIFNFVEKLLKKAQLKRARSKNNKLGSPFGVVIKDGLMKFHVKDVRKDFRDRYLASSLL